jgi:hypothetical protein
MNLPNIDVQKSVNDLHLLCGEERNSILLSITNKTQRYTLFFITVDALHVSAGFSAHQLIQLNQASGSSK